jgi:hypothetical protein
MAMSIWDYDRWGGMLSLREAMNWLLEESFVAGAGRGEEDIDVTITGDTLTIRGELPDQAPAGVVRYHHREPRSGALARSLTLPLEVQFSRVEATFENGVLTLTLPKAEHLPPKTIKVNVGGGATAIRAQAGASRSARDDERAEVAPTTDEASAESGRTQQTTDEASAERSHSQQTTATRQTGGAAGPSDETADLPPDASGAS